MEKEIPRIVVEWDVDGTIVPIECVGPLPEEMEHFLDVIAEFAWKHRNVIERDDSKKSAEP